MVKQQARFHLTMLLSRYSNPLADKFAVTFKHRERERSSNKSEILEINDYWYNQIRGFDPMAAKLIRELPVDDIDAWIGAFDRKVINRLLAFKGELCRASA